MPRLHLLSLFFVSFVFAHQSYGNSFGDQLTQKIYNERVLWNPTDFKPWYEWWYYKVVEPESGQSFYFVYGLVNPWDLLQCNAASKSFVNAGSFDQKKIIEQNFKPQDYSQFKDNIIDVGDGNSLNPNHLRGSIINDKGQHVSWDLETSQEWSFNAMSWSMFVPEATSIYWYPAQASLRMTGWIDFDGKRTEFANAPGYQDRNWGRSFPKWWAWLVSNQFEGSPETVLAAGGGRPDLFNLFPIIDSFTIGLLLEGKEYTWSLPQLDHVEVDIVFGRWVVKANNRDGYRIEIEATAPKNKFMILNFTTPQGQIFKDYETLTGDMVVRLYKLNTERNEYEPMTTLHTHAAGIEYGSDQEFKLDDLFTQHLKLH